MDKPRPYPKLHGTAAAWAIAPENWKGGTRLAEFLAELTAPMAQGIYIDNATWDVFAKLGCRVCQRLGYAICDIPECPEPGCPLGLGEGQSAQAPQFYAAEHVTDTWLALVCAAA
jgi:hypothetical protein